MPSHDTPGVYYERADANARGISALRTDVAAFVGIAERGPLHSPVPIESLRQFAAHFGGYTGAGYLAYTVRAFFENGGRRCWIVRVASEAAATAALTVGDGTRDVWRIDAASPGVRGNDLTVRVAEVSRAQTRSRKGADPTGASVDSVAGFARATLVRITQGAVAAYRVVSAVDPARSRIGWVNEVPELRLPYDAPLTGFDPNRPINVESVAYTIAVYDLGRLVGVLDDLALVPEHPRYGPRVVAPLRVTRQSLLRNELPALPLPIVLTELRDLPGLGAVAGLDLVDPAAPAAPFERALQGGADGLAALRYQDFIGERADPLDSDPTAARKARGLAALDAVDEVALVAIPDIHIQPRALPPVVPPPPCIPDACLPMPPPLPAAPRPRAVGDLPPQFPDAAVYAVQAALVEHCERHRDRLALLDPPYSAVMRPELGIAAIQAWRSRFDSSYAALYYPWIAVEDPLTRLRTPTLPIPPSGHVAGQCAATDLRVGVHKAPANAPLGWAQDLTFAVGDAEHGVLNSAGVNALRALPGRGLRINGARIATSASDWRFVNVRRLMMMIEKAIGVSLAWAVFEPNSVATRHKLQLVLRSFLAELWQRGALMGAAPEEAFFVRCDDGNNPSDARARGELLAEVGVAPSVPFEFVVLRVGRDSNGLDIAEQGALASMGA